MIPLQPVPDTTRKIVQIATSSTDVRGEDTLFALCNDGTVWYFDFGSADDQWRKLKDIPQPE